MLTAKQRKRVCEESKAFPGRIDREAGIIRDCAILGKNSSNGRINEDQALEKAVELYEGCPVRMDHKPGEKRGVIDDVGVLRDIRKVAGKVRGDLHLNLSHPLADFVMERAEKFPTTFGFSLEADGLVEEGADGKQHVTDLVFVESVDLVSSPATNNSLFESTAKNSDPFDVQQMFEDHSFQPSSREFEICSQLPPRLRDGYIDTLRAAAEGRAEDDETKRLREQLFGIPSPRPSLMDQLRPTLASGEQAYSQRFKDALSGVASLPRGGEFENALASFRNELRR